MLEQVGHYYIQKAGQAAGKVVGDRIEPGFRLKDRSGLQFGQEQGTPEIFEPE